MSRRAMVRRGIKKRGVLPSFGDIVLPIVSIAAVALLVIAGRQFFLNGLKSSPGISSTRAYAEAPILSAERKSSDVVVPVAKIPISVEASSEPKLTEVKIEAKPEPQSDFLAIAVAVPQPQAKTTTTTTTQSQQVSKTTTSKSTSNATVKKTASTTTATTKAASLPANKQWRIQVGAYTSKAIAQDAANKINKAGYKATVYQNPASKYVKVWVQGGADKQSAEKIVAAMKKLGFKGSFSFPPAK